MCECDTTRFTTKIHEGLRKAEEIPVLGLFPSVLQAVVSVAETVMAIAFTLLILPFMLAFGLCCRENCLSKFVIARWNDCMHHVALGTVFTIQSLLNIVTLGSYLPIQKCNIHADVKVLTTELTAGVGR